MNTFTIPRAAMAAPADIPHLRPISRFFNIAVSVAVIAALALGGWFATMQLNQPGDPTPDPRFAAIATPGASATPQTNNATCDVEPLSVDRVMEIVEHPGYFMHDGAAGERNSSPGPASPPGATLWELDIALTPNLQEGSSVPSPEQFESATDVANEYVNCMIFGTQGQVWNFYSPAHIQASILGEFPVYSSEADVRARVEERLNEPAYTGEVSWEFLPYISDIGEITINPDSELAILHETDPLFFDQVMMVGVSIKSTDGEQIALTVGTGRDLVPNSAMHTGTEGTDLHITLAKVRGTDSWFIIPSPSRAEIGW